MIVVTTQSSRRHFPVVLGETFHRLVDDAAVAPANADTARCSLRALGIQDTSERDDEVSVIRRNDPCPCGSGRKFKKC